MTVGPAVTDPAALFDCWGAAEPLVVGDAVLDELPLLVGADEPGLEPEAEGGVNGTVVPRPGSLVDCTLAVNCWKVLLPVVGALMAPNMLGGESFIRPG